MHAHDHAAGHAHFHGTDDERIHPGTAMWDAHHAEHIQRYRFVADRMPHGAVVLDAGCGVGYGSAHLAERGAGRVIAVDLSAEALGIARGRFARPGIEWIQEDCMQLTQARRAAPFDLIANLENIEHLPDPAAFLTLVTSLLKPGGVFVTTTPERNTMARLRGLSPDLAPANPHHTMEFTSDEFRTFLEGAFERVEMAWQTYDPLERMWYEPALAALWHNPFVRAGRWLQRVVRRRPVTPTLEGLLPPRRYQILGEDPGPGLAITVMAVCRGPRAAAR